MQLSFYNPNHSLLSCLYLLQTSLFHINIFGLPWLEKQGWIAPGSEKGGHHFTLGSTSLYVIKSSLTGEKPEGEVVSPDSLCSNFSLPQEFEQFADVLSPQANCTLPPHRHMDISIKLENRSFPPFGGLYNLSMNEQQQLKKYIDENLKGSFVYLLPEPQPPYSS
jgi:hypothetical protein